MSSKIFDFSVVTSWVHEILTSLMPPLAVGIVEWVMVGVMFIALVAFLGLALVYAERKVCADFQQRLGPNRVGPFGLFQLFADTIKLLMKELVMPAKADKFLFNLAPFIAMGVPVFALGAFAYAKGLQYMDLDIGVLYITSVTSVSVIGVLLAGWSSNSKFSLIGAIRSGAQIISYELSVGLSLVVIVLFAQSMSISDIINSQQDGWWIFKGHIPACLAFIMFLIAGTAETNRGPFDLAEAESELTGGFHTEYSGIKFAFFFLSEYVNLFIISAIAATLFLGGWMPLHIGGFDSFNMVMDYIPSLFWFFGKTAFVIFIIMWFKWTFPRLRVDQILTLEWKYLMPLNLMNIIITAILVVMKWHF